MPEAIINGPAGRIECRFKPAGHPDAPIALILHPEPDKGGTMNNRVTFALYNLFREHGFSVMRFNFRGVGRSEGEYDNGDGELADAATVMDWLQSQNPAAKFSWVAGFSFGSWIGMQLMMRRPEIRGFIAVTPPAKTREFTFLAPCPASGLIIHGSRDQVVPVKDVQHLRSKIAIQRGFDIKTDVVPGADHFYTNKLEQLTKRISKYLDEALANMGPDPFD